MTSRKIYKQIALAIRTTQTRVTGSNYVLIDKEELITKLVEVFQEHDPKFSEEIFRKEIK